MGLEDEIWRSQAIVNGLVQADSFSWRRCAEETHAVYQELM
jgi:hypothetical protein